MGTHPRYLLVMSLDTDIFFRLWLWGVPDRVTRSLFVGRISWYLDEARRLRSSERVFPDSLIPHMLILWLNVAFTLGDGGG